MQEGWNCCTNESIPDRLSFSQFVLTSITTIFCPRRRTKSTSKSPKAQKGYVDLQKIELALRSSNFGREASFAIPSIRQKYLWESKKDSKGPLVLWWVWAKPKSILALDFSGGIARKDLLAKPAAEKDAVVVFLNGEKGLDGFRLSDAAGVGACEKRTDRFGHLYLELFCHLVVFYDIDCGCGC
jgi:hypothetical protein